MRFCVKSSRIDGGGLIEGESLLMVNLGRQIFAVDERNQKSEK